MKKIILLLAVMINGSMAFAEEDSNFFTKVYKVTIVNLTKGQPITPPVVTVHSPHSQLFKLGEEASQGLKELSQDGVTDKLVEELNENKYFIRTEVGNGVILPGQSGEIEIKARNSRFKVSVVAMLARTNDAILALSRGSLDLHKGQKVAYLASVYDAGAETNTESCAHIPAPPCNNPGVGTDGGEGIVHPHPGNQNIGDLEPLRDAFASKVAKIIIQRIK